MYYVQTDAYCGMTFRHGEYDDEQDARDRVARRLRTIRKWGGSFTVLGAGMWEIHEPEDCMMVPDWTGILRMDWEDEEDDDYFDEDGEDE